MIGEFINGPLWDISVAVFLIGVVFRLFTILRAGVKTDLSPARGNGALAAVSTIFSRSFPRRDIVRRGTMQVVAGYLFHIGLFILLFFAQPHIDFIAERITGTSWPAVPYWGFILSAELAFIGLLLLWLHRLLHPVTKLLSTAGDHIATGLVFLVMLSGCLALAQSFEPLRLLHLLLVELLLIYFPFSSLMHAFSFVFSRSYTGATMGRKGVKA